MAKNSKKPAGKSVKRISRSGTFVLGSGRFAKISEVEGIVRTAAMRQRSKDFDDKGLTGDQRREEIRKIYRKKA